MAEPSSSADPVVARLSRVFKTYDSRQGPVLRGIDLEIRRGDLISIVGVSGSGKTTLLNLLGCIDRPTSGQYELGGVTVDRRKQGSLAALRARSLGHVFQQYHLIEHLTVEENLSVRYLYGDSPMPDDFREVIRSTLVELGVGHLSEKYPRHLSGGEMQRVAIARALLRDPALLLGDEPTGNLDGRNASKVMELFTSATRTGTAVVLVTHNEKMAACCDRRFLLEEGRLVHTS